MESHGACVVGAGKHISVLFWDIEVAIIILSHIRVFWDHF